MLVEFRVENFRSFRGEHVLSMVASKGKELPGNTLKSPALPGRRLLKSSIIYGANGAGKSNLIRAINSFVQSIEHSADQQRHKFENLQPFALSPASRQEPSRFEATFIIENVRYQYGFASTSKAVVEEWLIAYPRNTPQQWFHRQSEKGQQPSWQFGRHLKGEKKRLTALTRPDALFLSVAAKFNHKQLTPIHGWFGTEFVAFDLGNYLHTQLLLGLTATLAQRDSAFRDAVGGFLQDADTGIQDIAVKLRDQKESEPSPAIADAIPSEVLRILKERFNYDIQTFHRTEGQGSSTAFSFEEESLGTQKVFALAGAWLVALREGYTLAFDELHSSLHPLLMRRLIELIHDPEFNLGGGQVILTCHDATLLDSSLFRRDQIWFVEKDKDGASHLYSLQEYRPRQGEALQKGYLAGRYSAIPFFGEFRFDEPKKTNKKKASRS